MEPSILTEAKVTAFVSEQLEQINKRQKQSLGYSIFQLMKELGKGMNDEKDIILSLFYANCNLAEQIVKRLDKLKETCNSNQIQSLWTELFKINYQHFYSEQILEELHRTRSFSDIYKKEQFYDVINRFVTNEMVIPEGYWLYVFADDKREVIIQMDQDVSWQKLCCAVAKLLHIETNSNQCSDGQNRYYVHLLFSNLANEIHTTKDVAIITASKLMKDNRDR